MHRRYISQHSDIMDYEQHHGDHSPADEGESSTDEYSTDFSDRDVSGQELMIFGIDQNLRKTKPGKRGLTLLSKLRTDFINSGGEKHKITFDELDKLSGPYRAEFPSYLGELVRKHVGLRYLSWKKVSKELKDKMWEKITVNIYFF